MPAKAVAEDVVKPTTEKEPPAEASTSTKKAPDLPFSKVVIHPLVLLSVVDHFNRISKSGNVKRVVGVLLGSLKPGGILDVANSFAVPFDEDEKDGNVFFLDHDYLEQMYHMFHKVAAKEKIVGWYHTGPKLRPTDININEMIKAHFCKKPVLVVIDAVPKELGLPTEAYIEIEQVHDDGSPPQKTFEHLPSEIGAEEAEEVGVEHLLRDIKDQTAGTLSQRVTNQYNGLRGLGSHLTGIEKYLTEVSKGNLPVNNEIIYLLQDALNLLPDVSSQDFARCVNSQTNDQMLCIFMGSLVRSVIALHNLIDNKLSLRDAEKEQDGGSKKKEAEDKEKKGDKEKDGEKKKEEKKTDEKKSDEKKK